MKRRKFVLGLIATCLLNYTTVYAVTPPDLNAYQSGNAVKTEVGIDIDASDLYSSHGFESNESTTNLDYGVNGKGNQSITTEDRYSGTIDYPGVYTKSKIITLNGVDPATADYKSSGINSGSYEWSTSSSGPWNSTATGSFVVNDNITYYFRVRDKVGNTSDVRSITVSNIDCWKPTITAIKDTDNWVNSDPLIHVNSSDSDSGINRLEYSEDQINWIKIASSSQSEFNYNKNETIYFRAIDNTDNISDIISVVVGNLDTTKAKIDDTVNGYNGSISVNVTDNESGIKTVTFN